MRRVAGRGGGLTGFTLGPLLHLGVWSREGWSLPSLLLVVVVVVVVALVLVVLVAPACLLGCC